MSKVDLTNSEPNKAWKQKMMLLNKEQIIDLFAKELKRIKPLKEKVNKLQKYRDDMEEMLQDSEQAGEFLAGL